MLELQRAAGHETRIFFTPLEMISIFQGSCDVYLQDVSRLESGIQSGGRVASRMMLYIAMKTVAPSFGYTSHDKP